MELESNGVVLMNKASTMQLEPSLQGEDSTVQEDLAAEAFTNSAARVL